MNLYMIRRKSAAKNGADLKAAAARSGEVADAEFPDDIAWIRSYVVSEPDGALGTFCIYQATSEDAVRAHADQAGLPANEVTQIADTVIVRPDPETVAA